MRFFKVSSAGLTVEVAKTRLLEFGKNDLLVKPVNPAFHLVFSQLQNPFIIILLAAGAVSALFSQWLDAGVIFSAVFINTVLGFVEEYKADRSLYALKRYLPVQATVRRGGMSMVIPAEQIVPGDLILLSTGDKITADARVVNAEAFEVSEALLTGESLPVKKIAESTTDTTNLVFAGSTVSAGRALVVALQTGAQTQLGRLSDQVAQTIDEKTPLQTQLAKFSLWLANAVVFLSALIFVIGIWRDIEVFEMLKISIAIAVSAIPEGLAISLTVILAIGMQRILKKRALVRHLVAAETLGSVGVICMDKTGTLTTGEMSAVEFKTPFGQVLERAALDRVLLILGATSTAVVDTLQTEPHFLGSPTEVALAKSYWFDKERLGVENVAGLAELPFSSERKYKAGVYKVGNERLIFVVGAPDMLLKKLSVSDENLRRLHSNFKEMAARGRRVLLVAQVLFEKNNVTDFVDHDIVNLEPLGFIGLADPLRASARATVEQARRAGLHPIMITGDYSTTALLIARQAGLVEQGALAMTGEEIMEITDVELQERVLKTQVFARVAPEHKLRIIRAWQANGATVAMVGDGVNDALSIKGADIGIALGSGTEVARETADIVLLDDNFSTVISAIKEGRTIFDNLRKVIVYLLCDSFSEIILIAGSLLLALPLPILPAQILWINLITDGFPSVALTFEPSEKGLMSEPPRPKKEPIMNTEMKVLIFLIGIFSDALLFAIYVFLHNQELDIEHIRTFIFAALGLNSLLYVFAVRTFRSSIFRTNPFSNRWLLAGVALGFVMLALPLTVPFLKNTFVFSTLSIWEWLVLFGLSVLQLLLIEIVKEIFNKGPGLANDFFNQKVISKT